MRCLKPKMDEPAYLLECEVMTGIDPVVVRQPRVRDQQAAADDPRRICFSPSILSPYMRRSSSIETLLPILYLRGISTGDSQRHSLLRSVKMRAAFRRARSAASRTVGRTIMRGA